MVGYTNYCAAKSAETAETHLDILVRIVALLGIHIRFVQKIFVNLTPLFANLSRLGVFKLDLITKAEPKQEIKEYYQKGLHFFTTSFTDNFLCVNFYKSHLV